jgi:hypothetical protein
MQTARIARLVGAVLLLGFVPGCSENNELNPGTFTVRLSGARTEALSGSAVAGVVFSEQGVSYTINMLDQGDEFVFLTDAVSESLVVRESGRGVIAGSLDFTGPLAAGETEEGDLNASATFDAEPIAAGGRSSRVLPLPLVGFARSGEALAF